MNDMVYRCFSVLNWCIFFNDAAGWGHPALQYIVLLWYTN